MGESNSPTAAARPGRWDGDGPSRHKVTSLKDQQHEQSSEDLGLSRAGIGFPSQKLLDAPVPQFPSAEEGLRFQALQDGKSKE